MTVEIKFYQTSFNNIFQDEFDKIYHSSQRMSDFFHCITDSSELN